MKRLIKKLRWLLVSAVAVIAGVFGIAAVSDDNNLSWQHDGLNVDGFYVYHKVGTGAYTRIQTLPDPAARAYLHANQDPGVHCYRVSAFNAGGESDLSNEACKTILFIPTPPFNLSVN